MSTDKVDLSHLDVKSLRTFKDSKADGVQWFIDEIGVLMDNPVDPTDPSGTARVSSMQSLANVNGLASAATPLKLGRLGKPQGADAVGAAPLNEFHKRAAMSLTDVEVQQQTLFGNISQNLAITIATMESAQDSSLDQVESGRFLDDWANINDGLVPPKRV
ncbi:type VII secretion system-associated protein [Streptomyces sp. NPDC058953]|uniref:type VII secretion system-associated protein n=1 Tax=unclassified Streptomyces TaxID=2593676 RepID=UPI00368C2DCC